MSSAANLLKVKRPKKRVRSGLLEYVFYWTLTRKFNYDAATIEHINYLVKLDSLSEKPQQMRLINKLLT